MSRRRKQIMPFREALSLVDDDMPDGAYFAMAHDIAGLEYGEGFDELASEAPANKPFPCLICGKYFRSPHGVADHQRDVHTGVSSGPPPATAASFENERLVAEWEADKEQRQRQKQARSDQAQRDFMAAAQLAIDHGLTLLRHTPIHFQLKSPRGWIINLYPSNRRIYSNGKTRGPFLSVPDEWTLMDVVRKAIEVKSC